MGKYKLNDKYYNDLLDLKDIYFPDRKYILKSIEEWKSNIE